MKLIENSYGTYYEFNNEEIMRAKTDKELREKLVENSYAFVLEATKTIHLPAEYTNEDKMQIGWLGFLKALDKFSPDKNVKFYTFAFSCVRGELFNEYQSVKTEKRGWNKETQRGPIVVSMDAPLSDSEPDITYGSMICDETVDVHYTVASRVTGLEFIDALLTPTQQKFFKECIIDGKTYQEVADKYGVSRARVGAVIKKCIEIIKERFTEQQLAELLGL